MFHSLFSLGACERALTRVYVYACVSDLTSYTVYDGSNTYDISEYVLVTKKVPYLRQITSAFVLNEETR